MTKNRTTTKSLKTRRASKPAKPAPELPTTLMGHLNELKSRLFWVVLFFIVSAAAVYPFFTDIVAALTRPLGGVELHYLTPAGGLSFIIKICMYLGIIGALPAFIYHLYKFVQPVMTIKRKRVLIGYTLASVILAACGIMFTYGIILPAAVRFLTSFEIVGVQPMLSVDSYMSFVIAYIVAGAFLFQLPIVMLIINSITPLTPKKLLSYERHVILGAVIAGAVLSPTPDVINQLLLALPLIVMYQLGFIIIVVKNKLRQKKLLRAKAREARLAQRKQQEQPKPTSQPRPRPTPTALTSAVASPAMSARRHIAAQPVTPSIVKPSPAKSFSMDGFRPASSQHVSRVAPRNRPSDLRRSIAPAPQRSSQQMPSRSAVRSRSMDGVIGYRGIQQLGRS